MSDANPQITEHTIGQAKFKVDAIRVNDIDAFQGWVRRGFIKDMKEVDPSLNAYDLVLSSRKIKFGDEATMGALGTVSGQTFLLWAVAKRNGYEGDYEKFQAEVGTSFKEVAEIIASIFRGIKNVLGGSEQGGAQEAKDPS